MSDNGRPLWTWIVLGAYAAFPLAAAAEVIGPIFSRRIRAYILKHPIAHALWFLCALFMTVAILIPYPSTPRHPPGEGGGTNYVMPKRLAGRLTS